jgi:formylmethanofuran dehydrogenase subunit E
MSEQQLLPDWLLQAPYLPRFEVRDTRHKYGRYDPVTKVVTVDDLVRFHGHLCGGLMEAAVALRAALDALFPEGVIDRTDIAIISNNSACGGDVAAYLTGARARFGSHIIDLSLKGGEFFVRQESTGQVVHVRMHPDVYPHEVKAQMRKLESGTFEPEDIDRFGELQWAYAGRLAARPASETTQIQFLNDFQWPDPTCQDLGRRRDNDFKNQP